MKMLTPRKRSFTSHADVSATFFIKKNQSNLHVKVGMLMPFQTIFVSNFGSLLKKNPLANMKKA